MWSRNDDSIDLFTSGNLMVDFLRNVFSLNAFTPRYMVKTAFDVMLQSADVLKCITPEEGRQSFQEFQNKLQAFYLFEYVDSVLGFSPDTALNLNDMLHRTRSLGPFFSVWATEGVGHYYSYLLASGSALPQGILSEAARDLPLESLIPLHTGMGLALAETQLSRQYDTQALAESFVQLCHSNSRHEYWPASVEALGLVVRNLRPDLIAPLDHHFSNSSEELLAYFWHGIGRGTYFAPVNSLPCWNAPCQGYEMCMQAPHELGRLNAIAGFVWAMTLVNLRHPEIVAAWLHRYSATLIDDAAANGIFSALLVWSYCAPSDFLVRAFGDYQPAAGDSFLSLIWEKQVRQTVVQALHYHGSKAMPDTGKIFRYQPLVRFADECKFNL